MNIGELSKRTGLNASTIRYYEKMKIIPKAKRDSNGYRNYDDSHLQPIWFIQQAKQVGFSLAEIQALLPSQVGQWQHDALLSALENKIQDIERLQQRLEQSKRNLKLVIDTITHKPADMSCQENAQRLFEIPLNNDLPFLNVPKDTVISH